MSLYQRSRSFVGAQIDKLFFTRLIKKTDNFSKTYWLGKPIWQNTLDLWTIQETIWDVKPDLLIECGTNRGGSAYFYANLFDLMQNGEIVTIDVEKLHDLVHPRITFLLGSSTSADILEIVQKRVKTTAGPIMVILDSDHSTNHVRKEMELYAPFVTRGSYMLVQDGVIDTLAKFKRARPGPLPAIKEFLGHHTDFVVDSKKGERFLISHHPSGWLKRVS